MLKTCTVCSIGFIILFITSCGSEHESDDSRYDVPEPVVIDEYRELISYEEALLYTPTVIEFDGESILYVYDYGHGNVQMIDISGEGEIVGEIGSQGQGPGEFFLINNLFLIDEVLYLIDYAQFFIHQFTPEGDHIASLNYGDLGYLPDGPLDPMSTGVVTARNINQQPHITLNQQVMLSPRFVSSSEQTIYDIRTWEGEKVAEAGRIDSERAIERDPSEIRAAADNMEIPGYELGNVFPVNDPSTPGEIFLVHSAVPKIAKYTLDGEKLWERAVPYLPEIEDTRRRYFDTMDEIIGSASISFSVYMAGVSGPDGTLYLATNTNPEMPGPQWVHEFNPDGELIRRYHLRSDEKLVPVFDVDFNKDEIIFLTKQGSIRMFSM